MRFSRLTDLWRAVFANRPARRSRNATRLTVEGLEQRWVPAGFAAATAAELIADINAANLTPEPDTITLAAGATFTLSEVNNTVNGPTGLPQITAGEDLTIVGNGAVIERSTANNVPAFRLFDVTAGASLTLQDLTLQGGLAFGYSFRTEFWSFDSPWPKGGAVYNQGALILEGVTVQNNVAQGADGIQVWGGVLPGGDAAGGGIYSSGVLTMVDSTLKNNAAIGGRGEKGYSVTYCEGACFKSTVPGSDGGNAYGGGLYVADGTVTIANSSVTANTAQGGAAGGQGGRKGQGVGGGIYIDVAAWVGLDDFTVARVKKNHASAGDNNIAGVYDVIP